MPVIVLRALAWGAENLLAPLCTWGLHQAESAMERHWAAKRAAEEKKKGAPPTEAGETP